MKKQILFLATLLILGTSLHAQKRRGSRNDFMLWFTMAGKAGFGNSVLYNNNVANDNRLQSTYFTPSYSYGGRFGIVFGEYVSLSVDILGNNWGQKYKEVEFNNSLKDNYEKNLKFQTREIGLTVRYTGGYGGYFELGTQFSKLTSFTETNSSKDVLSYQPIEYYNQKLNSLIVGFGLSLYRSDNARFAITLGPRITYSFTDLMNDSENFDKTKTHIYPITDSNTKDFYIDTKEYTYKSTKPIMFQMILEVNYWFGYMGKANCGALGARFFTAD